MAQQNTSNLQHALQQDSILKSVEEAIKQKNTKQLKLSLEFHSRIDDMFHYLLTTKKQEVQHNAVRVRQWKQDLFAKHLVSLRELERDFEQGLEQRLSRLRFASFAQLSPSTIHQDVRRLPIPPMVPSQAAPEPAAAPSTTSRADIARDVQQRMSVNAAARNLQIPIMDTHRASHAMPPPFGGPAVQKRRNTVGGDRRSRCHDAGRGEAVDARVQFGRYKESKSSSHSNFGNPKVRHVDGAFCCPHCHSVFAAESTFIAHVRAHQKEKNFRCPACGDRYHLRGDLVQHIESKHPEVLRM